MKHISAAATATAALAALLAAAPAATAQAEASAPTNLHITTLAADHVNLAWDAVPGATQYFVDGTPCSPVHVGDATAAWVGSISVDPVCGLFPGQTYRLTVRAQDSSGNSPQSNAVTVTLTK